MEVAPTSTTPMTTIYVKGTPEGLSEDDVKAAVGSYGDIVEVTLPEGKDFCFVTYADEKSAESAVSAGETTINGASITMEMKRGPRRRKQGEQMAPGTSSSIYIPNMSSSVTEEQLRAAFSDYGEVHDVSFRNRNPDVCYAFVELSSVEMVQAVLAAAPITVNGEELPVEERLSVARSHQRGNRGGDAEARAVGGEGAAPRERRGGMDRPPKPENSVYVKGFPATGGEELVREEFSKYGEIVSLIVRVKKIMEDDEIRTWAFVEFKDESTAQSAVEGSGSLAIGGQEVTVEARKSEPKLFKGRARRGRANRERRRS
ncbi:unnamed protein product [Chrysoparadoxa australica]